VVYSAVRLRRHPALMWLNCDPGGQPPSASYTGRLGLCEASANDRRVAMTLGHVIGLGAVPQQILKFAVVLREKRVATHPHAAPRVQYIDPVERHDCG
jgi:hypothetical protein